MVLLGLLKFTPRKFTLGDYDDLSEIQERLAAAPGIRERLKGLREIVLFAARHEHPNLTDEDLRRLEATPTDLRNSVQAVLAFNGMEPKLGEGEAADQAA